MCRLPIVPSVGDLREIGNQIALSLGTRVKGVSESSTAQGSGEEQLFGGDGDYEYADADANSYYHLRAAGEMTLTRRLFSS